jgi:hypothetical protein
MAALMRSQSVLDKRLIALAAVGLTMRFQVGGLLLRVLVARYGVEWVRN